MKMDYVLLGNLCTQIRGVSYKPTECSSVPQKGYIPVYRAHNIQNEGLNETDLVYVLEERIASNQYIKTGDIIICASSGSKGLVGKAAQAETDSNFTFGAFCKVARPNNNVNGKYLGLYFKSTEYRNYISSLAKGANINNLRNEDFDSIRIPFPSLDEQERLVRIIEAKMKSIETMRRAAHEQHITVEGLFLSYLQKLLASVNTKESTIGDFCTLMTGGTPTSTNKEYYENGNIPWLVSGDIHKETVFDCKQHITNSGMMNSNAKILPKGSVLIALAGQGKTRGTVAMLEMDNATCNQSLVSITPNPDIAVSKYIYYNLRSRYNEIRALTGDMERSGLSITRIKKIKVNLPDINKQKEIVQKIETKSIAMSKIKKAISERLSYMDALPSSILRQAFNGELQEHG